MARQAVILGGTGQVGRAVAGALLRDGWAVSLVHRGRTAAPGWLLEAGATEVLHDRERAGDLGLAIGRGADLVVDAIAFDAGHADQLLGVQADVGAFVVLSSSSVYRDADGRTLDEAGEGGFPDVPLPMTEEQPTVEPGPETYSTSKVGSSGGSLTARRGR
jgi:nucleoside-diphosphate-sugar epimerase